MSNSPARATVSLDEQLAKVLVAESPKEIRIAVIGLSWCDNDDMTELRDLLKECESNSHEKHEKHKKADL